MPSSLVPALSGRTLTVDYALKHPTILRDRITALADDAILLPRFYRPFGAQVQGGGLAYATLQASDMFTSDVEQRAPGSEYRVVEGVDPTPHLAVVEDWGGRFQVFDEQITRCDISYLDQQTTQLANTIARKLDTRALAALEAASIVSYAPASGWDDLVFVGPADSLTPSADRPSAHWSQLQLMADEEELGVRHDILVCAPEQAHQLRVAYGADLDAALESAGFTEGLYSNPRIPSGTAYAAQAGQVGVVGYETAGLVVEVYDDRATRSKWVQAYAVMSFAVDKPYAAKKITGLS